MLLLQLVERPIARCKRDNRVYMAFYVYECGKTWRERYRQMLVLIYRGACVNRRWLVCSTR